MKLLLIMGSDEAYQLISYHIKSLGFELIRYRHVLKAMDNVDEVDPAGIIVSAEDFPRHWKTLVQFVRFERTKDACPIIILRGNSFPIEEMAKAYFLEVNGLVSEDLSDPAEVEKLRGLLTGGRTAEKRRARRFHVNLGNRLGLIVSNPLHKYLVPGEIKTISKSGISFTPCYAESAANIVPDLELPGCSLRTGDIILSPVCRVVRTGMSISMEFTSFPGNEQKILESHLDALPVQEADAKGEAG
ncbi:MAG: PilZ domain-containing protein [Treponema sp.]|jgi:hypothetical protein|nr:PilZ domain-containing protein [Treponema sp.]